MARTLLRRGAGALVLAALTAWADARAADPAPQPASAGPIQRVTVLLDNYSFNPDRVVVQVGVPVELTLASVTTFTPHNFVLKEPSAGLVFEQEVGAGATVVLRFIPAKAGTYPFYCDKQLLFFKSHRERGMAGRLEVRE